MPIIKNIIVKKKNDYSVLIDDKTILNSELESFYKEFKKRPFMWHNLSSFEKAKIIAYITIVLNKNANEIIINDNIFQSFENKIFSTVNIVSFLQNSGKEKAETIKQIEKILHELENVYKQHRERFEKALQIK